MNHSTIHAIVFDLGGVLVDWNPRYLYRDLFKDDTRAMEDFLAHICTQEWNHLHDEGISFADNADALKEKHPAYAGMIDAWFSGFSRMLKGPIAGTVEILQRLHATGIPLYALTNWSAETFPIARERFDFLQLFRGIVVSGEEKIAKPDARIFRILTERYRLDPQYSLFIDDVRANIDAATSLGFAAIPFTTPGALAERLCARNLLPMKECA